MQHLFDDFKERRLNLKKLRKEYEKIGSDKLKGIKNNITKCYENKFKERKIEEIKNESDVPVTEAFELYLRSHFFKIKQNEATKKVLTYWKDLFNKNLKNNLNQLELCIEDQNKFNQLVADLIYKLNFDDSNSKNEKEKEEDLDQEPSSSDLDKQYNDSAENEQNLNEIS